MTSLGTITSGRFTVGGQSFVDFFNATMVGRPNFHARIDAAAFCDVFGNLPLLWAPEVSVERFVALFAIMYNETGGSLRPIAEVGGPRYCFETAIPGTGGHKASYNRHPNRLAGDQLLARGIIDEGARAAWNGTTWPAASEDVYAAARECDFFKFRGRGFIQTTWWTTYEQQIDPLLALAGLPTCDAMSNDELDTAFLNTPAVALGAVKAFFERIPVAFDAVERLQWAPVGTAVSGSKAYGEGVYSARCGSLWTAMRTAGGVEVDPAIDLSEDAPVSVPDTPRTSGET